MKNKSLFTGRANDYNKGRPAYSNELIDYMVNQIGITANDIVADIGSGTGIFSRQLLEKCNVICVEPNDDMRKVAENELSNYLTVQFSDGTAENTKLEKASVDFVTVAQAFHWFDGDKFKAECQRILKNSGEVMLVWNTRNTECEFNKDNEKIFEKYCPAFRGFSGGTQKDDISIQKFFDGKYQYAEFDNPIIYTKEQFVSRCLSASYSIKDGDSGYQEYMNELNALFEKYCENQLLKIPNSSVIYWGKI